jgi:hypothetical protein
VSHLSASQALRAAAPLPLSEVDITGCIESRPRTEAGERQLTPAEAAFAQAFATSLQQLPEAQRAGLQATAATSPKLSWRSSSLTSDGARCTTTSVPHQVVTG